MKTIMSLLGILFLAACGEPDAENASPAAAADEADTGQEEWDEFSAGCDLVTDAEIAAAIGEQVVSREEGGNFGCRWKTAGHYVELRVFPDTDLPEDSCRENQQSLPYGQTAKGETEAVSGLGDVAIWGSSGDLLVCTRRGLLVVNYEDSPADWSSDDELGAAISIAAKALDRLNAI